MGTKITDIVQVTISRESAKLTRTGFGTGMIVADHDYWPERVKTFSAPSDLIDLGVPDTDPMYLAALAMYQQTIQPQTFKVGKKVIGKNEKQVVTWNADGTAGTWTISVIKGTGTAQTTAAIAWDANAAAVKAALEALTNVEQVTITLNPGATKPSDLEGFTCEFTGLDAKTVIRISAIASSMTGATTALIMETQAGIPDDTWTGAYSAIKAADNDFYGVVALTITKADILLLAAAIEADLKKYYFATKDADCLIDGGPNVFTDLNALAYNRTLGVYSSKAGVEYPEAAVMSIELTRDPGSYTLKFLQVVGITPEVLSASDLTALKNEKANYIELIAGYTIISSEGVVSSGEYSDTIRFCDWLQTRMSEDVFQALINAGENVGKMPYTVQGYGIIENQIRKRLALGAAAGGITADSIDVTMPHPDDADPADKAIRKVVLKKVFSARLAGAVHFIEITGNLYL